MAALPSGDRVPSPAASLLIDCRCALGESILYSDRDDALLWTDILGPALWRYDIHSDLVRTWPMPAPLGCIGLGTDGRLLLGLAKGLYSVDIDRHRHSETLPISLLAEVQPDDPLTRINDGRADRHGGFVFGTKSEHADGRPAGQFFQYRADHGLRALDLPAATIPNSICFDASGTRMYFCDSPQGRILRCRYDAERAQVDDIETFVTLDVDNAEPDGSVVDNEDAVWNAQWGAGRIVRYLPDGRIERVIRLPVSQPSCLTIVGSILYISSARVGLSAAQRSAQPSAGGVFSYRAERTFGRQEDRVRLP